MRSHRYCLVVVVVGLFIMFQPQNKQKDFRISNISGGGNSSKICRTFYDQNLKRAGNYHRRRERRSVVHFMNF